TLPPKPTHTHMVELTLQHIHTHTCDVVLLSHTIRSGLHHLPKGSCSQSLSCNTHTQASWHTNTHTHTGQLAHKHTHTQASWHTNTHTGQVGHKQTHTHTHRHTHTHTHANSYTLKYMLICISHRY